MSAPNHTGLFLEEFHHTLRGMLGGLAEMQVSPVSMLQNTWIASSTLPWFGSTQYSPEPRHNKDIIDLLCSDCTGRNQLIPICLINFWDF